MTFHVIGRAVLLGIAVAIVLVADPQPGDVYREYTYSFRFGEVHAGAKHPGSARMQAGRERERAVEISSIAGAVKAEVSIEYWGGHIGTSEQKFRVNGSEWFDIPQPAGTSERPECYYRTVLGRATVEIPVALLKPGRNALQFSAGPQVCHSFNWGFYWVYGFTVRVYSDPGQGHREGRIVSLSEGGEIGDHPRLVAEAGGETDDVAQVDFIAEYEDFNWEGDGRFRQWHYILERGRMSRHIGTATARPFAVNWDTTWVPDQAKPIRIAARMTTMFGSMYITPAVTVSLRRAGRSVKMYKATDVPTAFGVRVGRKKECNIPVADPLANARSARLVLSTWSAAHGDEIGLNGRSLVERLGLVHNYSFDALPVPVGMLKPQNVFHIFSKTEEHAIEVNWPGPVLLVEYGLPVAAAAIGPWEDAVATHRVRLEVNAAGYARVDKPAEARVELPKALQRHAIRVVEVDAGGAVIDSNVPAQFDGDTVVWIMQGRTAPHAMRRYHAYFGGRQLKTESMVSFKDDVLFEGQSSFEIRTPAATYFYHKEGAGFAGLRDSDGAEWIGYHPGGRSAGEFRGIPNLGDFAHPGNTGETGSTSRIVSSGPLRVRILSEKRDRKWSAAWDIYPGYARMTVLRNAGPYWFLYEGTPGGKLDLETGFQVLASGERRPLTQPWSGDLPGPEWIYFGSGATRRVLFLANHQDDDAPDQYWPMDGNMTVFGFGREYRCCRQFLNWSPARFTVALLEGGAFEDVSAAVDSAYRELLVRVSDLEMRPAR
jgi:hypothetical protein